MASRKVLRKAATRAKFSALVVCCLLCLGCSPWLRKPSETSFLPPAQVSPESVTLDISFVNVALDDRSLESKLWQQFDEQKFPAEFRRALNSNGIRAGMVGTQLPEELQKLLKKTLDSSEEAPTSESITGIDAPPMTSRSIQLAEGRRAKIVVSPTFPSMSVLSLDDANRVIGQHFEQAQCLFSLRTYPSGDGGTRVELTPEIEHGESKNRWVPVSGALVQQIGKERKTYEKLRLNFQLTPGQTLVIGPTAEPCGVGQHFFSVEQPTQRRVLLLVRLAGSQLDDLFAPRPKKLDISTAME